MISTHVASRDSTRSVSTPAVTISDQRVSFRRSSKGKSNRVQSIWVVSSTETRSTQLNGSPIGSSSRILDARSRMIGSILARLCGETIGLTTLRWASCLGGSIEMNIGRGPSSSSGSSMVTPEAEEKTW